jgi:hypothetical protein
MHCTQDVLQFLIPIEPFAIDIGGMGVLAQLNAVIIMILAYLGVAGKLVVKVTYNGKYHTIGRFVLVKVESKTAIAERLAVNRHALFSAIAQLAAHVLCG